MLKNSAGQLLRGLRTQLQKGFRDPRSLWHFHPRANYLLRHGGDQLAPPITANIALTNKCNLRCEICGSQKFLDETGTRRRHMDFRKVQAVADTLFPFLITVELNSQGDPLLYPKIAEVLELIACHRCELKVQTNGTLFTDRVIDVLMRQVGEVNLSLDAVGPKFDEVRQGGVWSEAEPGLKRFLSARDPAKLTVGLYPTVTRRTVGEGIRLLDWAAEHGVDAVVFHRYSPIQGSFEELPSEIECAAMQLELANWTAKNGNQVRVYFESRRMNQRRPRLRKKVRASDEKHKLAVFYAPFNFPIDVGKPGADPTFSCTAPLSYVEIGLDGQISACCRSQDIPLGYATSVEAFADAWFGPNYARIRESLRRGAAGPYPLPNCESCIKFFAPGAAGMRHAISYDADIERMPEALEFNVEGDVRIEGIGRRAGHCFHSNRLPPGLPGDAFELWEDNRVLGPANATLETISEEGQGRFAISGRSIYFASSDNTDPRRNLRSYVLRRKSSKMSMSNIAMLAPPAASLGKPANRA